jgi:hypothetical protein
MPVTIKLYRVARRSHHLTRLSLLRVMVDLRTDEGGALARADTGGKAQCCYNGTRRLADGDRGIRLYEERGAFPAGSSKPDSSGVVNGEGLRGRS